MSKVCITLREARGPQPTLYSEMENPREPTSLGCENRCLLICKKTQPTGLDLNENTAWAAWEEGAHSL